MAGAILKMESIMFTVMYDMSIPSLALKTKYHNPAKKMC
jgi:hypothetical protein